MMRRLALLILTILIAGAALWLFARRDSLRLQWECFQVTSAGSYDQFKQQIDQFEQSGDGRRLRALADRWHTGNETFDDHLARYLYDPQCSDEIREAFSRQLSWRDGLFTVWAEHWRQQKPDVQEQMASLRRYLETLGAEQPPRDITWRDVLDFQAVLELSGHGELAHRLTPDNWRLRYHRWIAALARETES